MVENTGRLHGRLAVITGGSEGFGRVIARRFSDEGARLIVNGLNREAGDSLIAELEAEGREAQFVYGDVGEESTADEIAATAAAHGPIDVLMLNAGVASFGTFWESTPAEFDHIMRVNVRGAWLCGRAMQAGLADGASVIVTASVSSFVAPPGESIYSISKGAALQLARSMAADLAPRGIRVNALCPGAVGEVGMQQRALDTVVDGAWGIDELHQVIPLKRLAKPSEIADAALFLASSESSYMTGASLVVDGGLISR